jgi:two-component system, response regulator RegA
MAALLHSQWVLVADDDVQFAERLARIVRERGQQVELVHSAREMLRFLSEHRPHSVIFEPSLPGAAWCSLMRSVRKAAAPGRLIVATAYPSIAMAREARASDWLFMKKPMNEEQLAEQLWSHDRAVISNWHRPRLGTMSLARVEWEYLNRALRSSDGNVTRAARTLAIPRQTVYRKLRTFPPPR